MVIGCTFIDIRNIQENTILDEWGNKLTRNVLLVLRKIIAQDLWPFKKMNRRNFNQRQTELAFLRTVRDLEIKNGEEEERAKKTNLSLSNEVVIRSIEPELTW